MPPPKNVSHDEVCRYFALPLKDAAKQLQISETMLKKYCRKKGILNWPYRVFKNLDATLSVLEGDLVRPGVAMQEKALVSEKLGMLKRNREYLKQNPTLVPLLTHGGMHLTSDLTHQLSFFRNMEVAAQAAAGAPAPASAPPAMAGIVSAPMTAAGVAGVPGSAPPGAARIPTGAPAQSPAPALAAAHGVPVTMGVAAGPHSAPSVYHPMFAGMSPFATAAADAAMAAMPAGFYPPVPMQPNGTAAMMFNPAMMPYMNGATPAGMAMMYAAGHSVPASMVSAATHAPATVAATPTMTQSRRSPPAAVATSTLTTAPAAAPAPPDGGKSASSVSGLATVASAAGEKRARTKSPDPSRAGGVEGDVGAKKQKRGVERDARLLLGVVEDMKGRSPQNSPKASLMGPSIPSPLPVKAQ